MPPAPRTGNAVTGPCDQAGAAGTRASAPVMPGSGPAAASSGRPGSARAETGRGLRQRVVGLLRLVPKSGSSYHDPLFERPGLVEDDYYRFRNQPYGGSRPDARSPG